MVLDMVSMLIPKHMTDVAGATNFSMLMSSPSSCNKDNRNWYEW